jgi:hypothetical protein
MDNFEETFKNTSDNLFEQLNKLRNKQVISSGTKVRKHAQELKKLLQDLRIMVLAEQKKIKEDKKNKSKE